MPNSRVTTGLYEFDPHGTNPNNLIEGERHTLQAPGLEDYHFIIPFAAPFFIDSLELVNDQTNTPYVLGVDYLIGHYFVEAMEATGKQIAGSIRFLKRNTGGIVRLKYRTLGGPWGFNDAAILEELSNRQYNPLVRSWGMIEVLPFSFPPVPHDQSVDDLVGSDDLLVGLEEIKDAISASAQGTTDSHLNDKSNPHGVTKQQVELGQVANYPPTTRAQAENGSNNESYMTPLMTAYAINVQALAPLNAFIARRDNPNAVTKQQVGLGQVANYPPATPEEAVDPAINNRYLTPYTASLLLQQTGDSGRITSLENILAEHLNDQDNPHGLTPAKIGTYTKEEIDQMLVSGTAEDTQRFSGMTEEEWRESLPNFDQVTDLVDNIGEGFTGGVGLIGTINTEPPPVAPAIGVGDAYAGYGRYILRISDGTESRSQQHPSPAIFPDIAPDSVDITAYAILENAAYVISPEGFIHSQGSNALPTPSIYSPGGTAPAVKPELIKASPTAVYLLLEDDTLVKYGSAGTVTTVATDVDTFSLCPTGEERAVYVQQDTLKAVAVGADAYTGPMNSVLSTLTDVADVLVIDQETYVLHEDGSLRGWSQTKNGANYIVAPLTIPSEYATNINTMSGSDNHAVFVTTDGHLYGRGNNDYGQCDVVDPGPVYRMAVAGPGYTVVAYRNGVVQYWGIGDDNTMLPPTKFNIA